MARYRSQVDILTNSIQFSEVLSAIALLGPLVGLKKSTYKWAFYYKYFFYFFIVHALDACGY